MKRRHLAVIAGPDLGVVNQQVSHNVKLTANGRQVEGRLIGVRAHIHHGADGDQRFHSFDVSALGGDV